MALASGCRLPFFLPGDYGAGGQGSIPSYVITHTHTHTDTILSRVGQPP